ncbi:MAG: DUF664 domain-containing protein [Myxococcales bacterium]|jgi:uncharacterized damage-inducible protein DinB|nr:DUF664 domain-containing protein [Myxococcales bacterium]
MSDLLAEQYRTLSRYNSWMNAKIYERAASLGDEERRRDLGAFFRSVHGTLNHLLLADRIWMGRFTGRPEEFASKDATGEVIPFQSLAQELYADFDQLRAERAATDAQIEEYCATLDAAALAAPLRYRMTSGVANDHPLWWALTHFFNHQTHHRGQASALLTRLGADVGVTDFIAFLRS